MGQTENNNFEDSFRSSISSDIIIKNDVKRKKNPKKILIIAAVIILIVAIIVLAVTSKNGGGGIFGGESLESAFSKYAEYVLFENSGKKVSGEYSDDEKYKISTVLDAKFKDNEKDNAFVTEAENLWKNVEKALNSKKNNTSLDVISSIESYGEDFKLFTALVSADIIDEKYILGADEDVSKILEKVSSNYKNVSESSNLGKEYANAKYAYASEYLNFKDAFSQYGCFKSGAVDNECIFGHKMSDEVAESFSKAGEKADETDYIERYLKKALAEKCFNILENIKSED